jgi:dipeptidyl aminopeptidase/acylaminoacyl peptidase
MPRALLAFVLLLLAPSAVPAQERQRPPRDTAAAPAAAPEATAEAKVPKVLALPEYGPWNRLTSSAISPDGKWMSYAYQPNDGEVTLHVKELDGDKLYTIAAGAAPTGSGPGGGGFGGGGAQQGPQFSDGGRFVGYYVNPPTAREGGRGGRPGGPGAQRPGAQGTTGAARPQRRFELLDLSSGEKFSVTNPASFRFSKGGTWLAVRVNRPQGDTTRDGGDLVLRELATGATRNVGNVNLYAFDDAGRLFAYTVDAAERLGNGIYLVDLATGATRQLDGDTADYAQLAWSDEGTHLAVLRGNKKKENKQKDNVLLAWTDLGTPREKAIAYDPAADAGFPKGFVMSEFATPRWSEDGTKVFLGVKEQEVEPEASDDPKANVDVWHWKDTEPQSVQIVRINQLRRATYPAVLHLASGKFIRLGDEEMRMVQPTRNSRWGIGRLDAPYRGEVAWGGTRGDYYRVNIATGERTLIERSLYRTMGTSPDSRWFLYLKEGHVYAYNLESGQAICVDENAGVTFVDIDDDHPYERPTYGVAGWSKDGRSVLLNHEYDVWQLPLSANGRAVNLTGGIGAAQEIRFRLVRFDENGQPRGGGGGGGFGGGFGNQDDEGVDLSAPQLLSAYGEWTKKSGYWRLAPNAKPTPLIWDDKSIGQVEKAKSADRLIFTQQTFSEFPDYWVASTAFASPRRVTEANPQLKDFAWPAGKVLIDYTNSKGQRLQGTLTLPAGYEPGKQYPMLVYFYEIMSNTHHRFSIPVYDDRPHISTYASDGYLVFQPDVVYQIGRPGTSAVDCVTSGVKRVIELGYADPAHIGLQGHSWGGYQSSYILTQTDMFAAVVTGAPPTNLVSFYNELYKQTGTVQQGIMEVGQVRMGRDSTPWTAHEQYEDQSPVHNVEKIKTPFLILHGTADGAVDWHQGLEYYNAARRNGKEVILLSYPDEPHHLGKKENQKDFQVRMKQFFDHYLKGTPAPRWMTEGVPQVRKGGAIK